MELALNVGSEGVENEPATKFFSTQEAIVSVTLEPYVIAFLEFFTVHPGRLDFWNAGAPSVKYSIHFCTLFSSDF
jgi:hypothetical protein